MPSLVPSSIFEYIPGLLSSSTSPLSVPLSCQGGVELEKSGKNLPTFSIVLGLSGGGIRSLGVSDLTISLSSDLSKFSGKSWFALHWNIVVMLPPPPDEFGLLVF